MDVTQLLNNYLESYIHVSLGSKGFERYSQDHYKSFASQERNSATNNYFESSYL